GIRDFHVTGVQTCALPILAGRGHPQGRLKAAVQTLAKGFGTVDDGSPDGRSVLDGAWRPRSLQRIGSTSPRRARRRNSFTGGSSSEERRGGESRTARWLAG